MKRLMLLRLEAPLMAFGAPIVDNLGEIQHHPGLSMLTGLLANALGFEHKDSDSLERLQDRLRYAARCDRPGVELLDYQTVDLGQRWMLDDGAWTTRGVLDERAGGDAKTGTHIRYRKYLADAIYTVAVLLEPSDEQPTLVDLEQALRKPARPLFIGRKSCLPSVPPCLGTVEAESPIRALERMARLPEARTKVGKDEPLSAWWQAGDTAATTTGQRTIMVFDRRDWANQVHTGQQRLTHGVIRPPEA
jgi:CRISPR system Cascade subunit CasD